MFNKDGNGRNGSQSDAARITAKAATATAQNEIQFSSEPIFLTPPYSISAKAYRWSVKRTV